MNQRTHHTTRSDRDGFPDSDLNLVAQQPDTCISHFDTNLHIVQTQAYSLQSTDIGLKPGTAPISILRFSQQGRDRYVVNDK